MTAPVYITRKIPDAGPDLLTKAGLAFEVNPHDRPLTRDELLESVKGREGIISLLTDKIDAEVMESAKGVRIIANYAVGYNNIDIKEAASRGIMVTNTPGILTEATADLTWALILASARRLGESERFLRAGKFEGWGPMLLRGGDVAGGTLGIAGAGRIGTAVAMRSAGFNMRVLYYDKQQNKELESKLNATRVALTELIKESDILSLHVPLLPETTHLIDENALRHMKPSAILINTSRGPVVDEKALAAALKKGVIAGAGLDVFENEPAVHPDLLACENAVLLPHIGSATITARTRMAVMAAENLLAGLKGERPPNLITPRQVSGNL